MAMTNTNMHDRDRTRTRGLGDSRKWRWKLHSGRLAIHILEILKFIELIMNSFKNKREYPKYPNYVFLIINVIKRRNVGVNLGFIIDMQKEKKKSSALTEQTKLIASAISFKN